MNKYILSCCSTADLSKEQFESRGISYICFHYELDGVSYSDDLGQSMDFKDFYHRLPFPARLTTLVTRPRSSSEKAAK